MKENKITQVIKEGERAFDENFCGEHRRLWLENTAMEAQTDCEYDIKAHITAREKAILDAVVEEMKRREEEIQTSDNCLRYLCCRETLNDFITILQESEKKI